MPKMHSLPDETLIKTTDLTKSRLLFSEMLICFFCMFTLLSYSSFKTAKLSGQRLKSKLQLFKAQANMSTEAEQRGKNRQGRSESEGDSQSYLGNMLALPVHIQVGCSEVTWRLAASLRLGGSEYDRSTFRNISEQTLPMNTEAMTMLANPPHATGLPFTQWIAVSSQKLSKWTKDPKENFYV